MGGADVGWLAWAVVLVGYGDPIEFTAQGRDTAAGLMDRAVGPIHRARTNHRWVICFAVTHAACKGLPTLVGTWAKMSPWPLEPSRLAAWPGERIFGAWSFL
jgi:hypothetical protein